MKEIKNIVFDFGGVLLDLDYNRTFQQMEALLGYPVSPDKVSPATTEQLTQYEKGLITTGTMVDHLKSTSTLNPSENDIIRSWNAMLLGWQTFKFDLTGKTQTKIQDISAQQYQRIATWTGCIWTCRKTTASGTLKQGFLTGCIIPI